MNLRNFGISAIIFFTANAKAIDAPIASNSASSQTAKTEIVVETPNGTLIDAEIYNQGMASQDVAKFCSKGECDSPPYLVKGYAPEYPLNLLREEITGQVVVIFTIDVKGQVVHPEIKSATRPEFAKSAIKAISSWKFRPATLNGKAVELKSSQIFPFELRE